LTRSTELTLAEADEFVKAYFARFPVSKIFGWDSQTSRSRRLCGNLLGRRRYFPALQSKQNVQMKNREEREAINAPIQGTAATL